MDRVVTIPASYLNIMIFIGKPIEIDKSDFVII